MAGKKKSVFTPCAAFALSIPPCFPIALPHFIKAQKVQRAVNGMSEDEEQGKEKRAIEDLSSPFPSPPLQVCGHFTVPIKDKQG